MYLLAYIWIVVCFNHVICFNCDFENDCHWNTGNNNMVFDIKNGHEGKVENYPAFDNTIGTDEGHYAIAVGNGGLGFENITRFLISPCLQCTIPNCQLQFSSIIRQKTTKLDVYILKNCTSSSSPITIIGSLTGPNSTSLKRWSRHVFNITNQYSTFKLALVARVPERGSYVTIDDLTVFNCNKVCPDEEFQCGSKCINYNKVCNLEQDCEDAEDESTLKCGNVPESGKATFENCSFHNEECWWYNVNENKHGWTIGSGIYVITPKDPHGNSDNKYAIINRAPEDGISILESPVFEKPRFAAKCQVGFDYYTYGLHLTELKLTVHELCKTNSLVLWKLDEQAIGNKWVFISVSLQNISSSFVLRFEAHTRSTFRKGDIAIDNISLSPDCFQSDSASESNNSRTKFQQCQKKYNFTSCGAKGQKGPSQDMCDLKYGSNMEVKVIEEGPYSGFQKWIVPESGVYSIAAAGARGGTGALTTLKPVYGDYVQVQFNLIKDDQIFILIGQKGEDACDLVSDKDERAPWCSSSNEMGSSKTDNNIGGGGGGGGGASVVFKMNKDNKRPVIILVAGGGGGLPFTFSNKSNSTHGADKQMLYAGYGGSLVLSGSQPQDGGALLYYAYGGKPCSNDSIWQTTGGFGGGGGACLSGGGGGGYQGGSVIGKFAASESGSSYASPLALNFKTNTDISNSSGWVDIVKLLTCPCEHKCIWSDRKLGLYRCLCPDNSTLNADNITCLGGSKTVHQDLLSFKADSSLNTGHWLAIVLPVSIVMLTIFSLYHLYRRKCHKKSKISLEEILTEQNYGAYQSRQGFTFTSNMGTAVMHYSPMYDVVVSKCSDQQLRELPRRHLKLARLLGHGAFGEVYRGYLANGAHLTEDLKVAVKTLPALCTQQTELDFLMEAVILSKFTHPNIVKVIGVCFESHPRYIVLELLDGGDLKTFLRECRPTPTRITDLSIKDLLRLCHDVACACQHLEEKHFIHRDIAARNCLLTTKAPERRAKIADFGMSRDIYRSDYYKKTGNALLPVKWMPTEALLDGIFTAKTDVWSYGILLWEVFSLGHMPYPGFTNEEVMQKVIEGGRLVAPEGCPPSVYKIMTDCWNEAAEERPSFASLVTQIETCLKDTDESSCELPVLYQPATLETRGLQLPSEHLTAIPNYLECLETPDYYLEPVIPQKKEHGVDINYLDKEISRGEQQGLLEDTGNGSINCRNETLLFEESLSLPIKETSTPFWRRKTRDKE